MRDDNRPETEDNTNNSSTDNTEDTNLKNDIEQ